MRSHAYPIFFCFTMLVFSMALVVSQGCKEEPCAGITCLNGGICATGNCICPEGFGGENCAQLTGEACNGTICLNGGACVNNECDCPPGWSGDNCSVAITDPCENIACLNGGVCVNGNCNCPPGFSGRFCEIVANDPCDLINCQNGGTCVTGVCDCLPGFSGPNCEISSNDPLNLSVGTYTGVVECTPLIGGGSTNEQLTVVITENAGIYSFSFSGIITLDSDGTPTSTNYEFSGGSIEGVLWSGPMDSEVSVDFQTATSSYSGILSI